MATYRAPADDLVRLLDADRIDRTVPIDVLRRSTAIKRQFRSAEVADTESSQ